MPIASEESEVDIEVEEMQESSEDEDEEGKEDEEDLGEDELESEPEQAQVVAAPLKIKLKLGAPAESNKPSSRRFVRPKNEDVESEDSDSDDSRFDAYTAAPSTSRQLTARQAALASAIDPSHITLDTAKGKASKKAQLPPSEVALRKEENARKRKNMIEKKLEDEKAETINRLLKKQSRPKHKRTSATATAAQSDEDVDMEEEDDRPPTPPPTMYRWLSTSIPPAASVDWKTFQKERKRGPTAFTYLAIPESLLAATPAVLLPADVRKENGEVKGIVSEAATPSAPARCAVAGCGATRKYRAVGKEWGVGACGLPHLKILEGR
ncbi:PAPA-1-like conserved region-domain-containing protein [Mycena galericulata]|nr:PAPA-1-like conserved region-domain-containing protein [Mycena galericulata]